MSRPRGLPRPTIRLKLTLIYASLFFVAGAALIGLTYFLVAQSLPVKTDLRVLMTGKNLSPPYLIDKEDLIKSQAFFEKKSDEAAAQLRQDTLDSLLAQSGIALGLVGVAAAGAGWLIAGRALAPIHQITETARRVADRSLHERIALDGPRDELTELANTFDDMLERLDRSFDGQRRFVGNASHELRTPLTINRTLIEVALSRPGASADVRQLGETLLVVNERHERLIDGLLTLAKSDREVTERVDVDLAELVEHVVSQSRPAAEAAGVEVSTALFTAPVTGDPVLLERLAHNLLDNAIAYNRPGGEVVVTTSCSLGQARLEIGNTGRTLMEYEVPRLFEPFRRGGADRTESAKGVGLGLSIVRTVVQAHGGEVSAMPRTGGGLVIEVKLPEANVFS
ncbi:sensor histidine kinase [Flindersiella endophytica]